MRGLGWFLTRRLLFVTVLVAVVSSLSLVLTQLAPGDATADLQLSGARPETIARARERAGLDRPFVERYVRWVIGAARFDF